MTNRTIKSAAPKSDLDVARTAHAKLIALPYPKRFKAFRKLDSNIQELVTQPCNGEAHSNAHIDYCMVCLNTSWGRVIKQAM